GGSDRGLPGAYRDGSSMRWHRRLQWRLRSRRCQNASKSSVGYCHASEALDREHFEAGTVKRSRAREPHACWEMDKVYRVNAIGELKNVQAVLQRISTRHALPPSRRTRPASKRRRSIRVSAR